MHPEGLLLRLVPVLLWGALLPLGCVSRPRATADHHPPGGEVEATPILVNARDEPDQGGIIDGNGGSTRLIVAAPLPPALSARLQTILGQIGLFSDGFAQIAAVAQRGEITWLATPSACLLASDANAVVRAVYFRKTKTILFCKAYADAGEVTQLMTILHELTHHVLAVLAVTLGDEEELVVTRFEAAFRALYETSQSGRPLVDADFAPLGALLAAYAPTVVDHDVFDLKAVKLFRDAELELPLPVARLTGSTIKPFLGETALARRLQALPNLTMGRLATAVVSGPASDQQRLAGAVFDIDNATKALKTLTRIGSAADCQGSNVACEAVVYPVPMASVTPEFLAVLSAPAFYGPWLRDRGDGSAPQRIYLFESGR